MSAKACDDQPTACEDYPNCPCGRAWQARPRARTVRPDGADVARSFRTVAHRVADRIAADLEDEP